MNFSDVIEHWYAGHKRDLPWREISDPYRIWISEIILQQTQVVQGYDYYLRFIERFPNVETLAEAGQDEVMRAWQGLGYYSRARNLHAASKSIVAQGGFPTTYEGVRALKGVGDYTAAAICSFAYGMPYAVIDGNVYRVLSRFFGLDAPIDTTAGKRLFAELAQDLLDKRQPGVYNQALMDFGAIQCTPKAPDCVGCPLGDACKALADGMVGQLPRKSRRTAVTHRYFVYAFVTDASDISACPSEENFTLLRRRQGGDIWEGLYEPPLFEFPSRPTEAEILDAIGGAFGEGVRGVKCLARGVKHVLTHRQLFADFYYVNVSKPLAYKDYTPVRLGDIDAYPVPRLVKMLYEAVFGV